MLDGLFIFRWGGKVKEMGLGSLTSVSLAHAREKAAEARRVLAKSSPLRGRAKRWAPSGRKSTWTRRSGLCRRRA
jgi:Arm DNA-binding domain